MSELKRLDQQLTVIDESGNEVLCQILFTFESEEFNKNYVLFYPIENEQEDDDNVTVMAASYKEGADGVGELEEVTTEEEWALIEDVLNQFEESMEEECSCEDCSGDEGCECEHHCDCHKE